MIERLLTSELDSLHQCATEFYASSRFLDEFRLDRFRQVWGDLIFGGNGVIFVLRTNSQIAGAIGGIVHQDIYGRSIIAEELFWFVREGLRGDGIRLYRQFEAWAKHRGAATIQMVHLSDLAPEKMRRFYLHEGFEPIETRYSKKLAA